MEAKNGPGYMERGDSNQRLMITLHTMIAVARKKSWQSIFDSRCFDIHVPEVVKTYLHTLIAL